MKIRRPWDRLIFHILVRQHLYMQLVPRCGSEGVDSHLEAAGVYTNYMDLIRSSSQWKCHKYMWHHHLIRYRHYWTVMRNFTGDTRPVFRIEVPLQWRHNECDGVSNHQPHDCLVNRLFKVQIKESIKAPCHWSLWGEYAGDPLTKGQ